MEYSRALRIIPFVLASAFPLMFLIVILTLTGGFQDLEEVRELESSWPIFVGVMLFIGVPSLILGVETLTVGHRISPDGIRKHSPWSRDLFLAWQEVGSITYNPAPQWFVIRSHKGNIRLNILLNGLKDFAHYVLNHVAEEAWEKAETQLLALANAPIAASPPKD